MARTSMAALTWTCFSVLFVAARGEESAQRKEKSEVTAIAEVKYLLSLPDGYEQKESWPLLIFLHGGGERGDDLEAVKKHGPPMRIAQGEKLPFIVVSPLCPDLQRWEISILDAWLAQGLSNLKIDRQRVYLTGISLGGFGTWEWASRFPQRFAAIVPICGGGDPKAAERIAHIPTWVAHGAKDPLVPLKSSEVMVTAIREAGGDPKFTVYPDLEHECWIETYADPKLYEWLSQQRQPGK